MTTLPVVDTALEGFRLTRERPLAVGLWGLVLVAGQAASAVVLIAAGQPAALAALRRPPPAADAVAARFAEIAPALPAVALAGVVGLVANVVVSTAVLRAVLTPGRRSAGSLRLGVEELRQLAVSLALITLAWTALSVAMLVIAGAAAPLAARGAGAAPLVTSLGLALAAAAVLFLMVRLSLAPAATQAEGVVRLRDAWPLTQGLFWPLFGAYLLAAALAGVVSLLAGMVAGALWAMGTSGGVKAAGALLQPDLSSAATAVTPAALAGLAFNGLLNAVLLTIVVGPGAAAYRTLRARAPAGAF